jgi:hypothetical protein
VRTALELALTKRSKRLKVAGYGERKTSLECSWIRVLNNAKGRRIPAIGIISLV